MKIAKYLDAQGRPALAIVDDETLRPLKLTGGQYQSLTDILEAADPAEAARFMIDPAAARLPVESVTLLPPLDKHEVWAAGVTYKRSRSARMEESVTSATVYDRVYSADRPELFFKSLPHKVVGHGKPVRIRRDATWNVPEPELALVINSRLHIVGYTIGNDMSSRDIEGENPLYLPQAKVYDGACAIGPWLTLADAMPPLDEIKIEMAVARQGKIVFHGDTTAGQLNRTPESLVEWLGRDNTFRDGVVLLTGTGIVPDKDFTLEPGDVIGIAIFGIGSLSNVVERRT